MSCLTGPPASLPGALALETALLTMLLIVPPVRAGAAEPGAATTLDSTANVAPGLRDPSTIPGDSLTGSAPVAFPPARVRSWQTTIRADRLQHSSLAFSSGLGLGLLTREPAAAAGGAMILGLAKELWDARRSRWDHADLIADAIGASLAALAVAALRD